MGHLVIAISKAAVELPDAVLATALDAIEASFLARDVVSVCYWERHQGRYVQVDASSPLDAIQGSSNGQGEYGLSAVAVYAGDSDQAEAAIDEALVDQIVDLMEHTGGCLVISREDELVLDLDAARGILRSAVVNPGH